MKASDIMHPEDAKALQMLKKLRGFDELIRCSMEYGYEKIFRGENLGSMVCHLSATNASFPAVMKNWVTCGSASRPLAVADKKDFSITTQRSDIVLYVEEHFNKIEDHAKAQSSADVTNARHYHNLLLRIKKIREKYESGK